MINEVEEFQCYTGTVEYTAAGKKDVAWMRRFTFDILEHFEGFGRVLTIIARGYMFDSDTPDIDRARRALLAWCSIPDSKKASPREGWQFRCCFSEYNVEFPELVDAEGRGWLYRHVHSMISFVRANPRSPPLTRRNTVRHWQVGSTPLGATKSFSSRFLSSPPRITPGF